MGGEPPHGPNGFYGGAESGQERELDLEGRILPAWSAKGLAPVGGLWGGLGDSAKYGRPEGNIMYLLCLAEGGYRGGRAPCGLSCRVYDGPDADDNAALSVAPPEATSGHFAAVIQGSSSALPRSKQSRPASASVACLGRDCGEYETV